MSEQDLLSIHDSEIEVEYTFVSHIKARFAEHLLWYFDAVTQPVLLSVIRHIHAVEVQINLIITFTFNCSITPVTTIVNSSCSLLWKKEKNQIVTSSNMATCGSWMKELWKISIDFNFSEKNRRCGLRLYVPEKLLILTVVYGRF